MSALDLALVVAALLIGVTGTWSPCGFSMIETIGPTGHTGGRRTTLAACATFAPGAIVGGAITYGALAAAGALVHGAGGEVALLIAATIALAAAMAEARGVPIVPQVRRQLPEHWRRVMPMPLAAGLYGVLLGLGFTTFVLSFGVWALAGIAFVVGDLQAGLLMGVAFGVGRAVPIAALAPLADRPAGIRATELMAIRPAIYRGFRLGDALALSAVAAALTVSGVAGAAETTSVDAADPYAAEADLVWQRGDQSGVLQRGEQRIPLPGTDPAIGGPYIAVLEPGAIRLLERGTLAPIARYEAPAVDAVTVSRDWVVYRTRREGRDTILARRITRPLQPSSAQRLARVEGPGQLGRPDLEAGLAVYAIAKQRKNTIVQQRIGERARALLSSRTNALSNPSVEGKKLLYVRTTSRRQRLMIKGRGGNGDGHAVYSRDDGRPTMWSTALGRERAYVTLLDGARERIVSVRR